MLALFCACWRARRSESAAALSALLPQLFRAHAHAPRVAAAVRELRGIQMQQQQQQQQQQRDHHSAGSNAGDAAEGGSSKGPDAAASMPSASAASSSSSNAGQFDRLVVAHAATFAEAVVAEHADLAVHMLMQVWQQ
jgi:hypothetical protein